MALVISKDSHIDHALWTSHLRFIFEKLGDASSFGIHTLELPEGLASLPCQIHGPIVGEAAVPESEVRYEVRGNRAGASRIVNRDEVMVRTMTVIVGPDDKPVEGQVVLYTAYGGPQAPREPWDPAIQDNPEALAASKAFWSEHALNV